MNSFTVTAAFLFFSQLLNAFSIGEFVTIEGLQGKPQLNGLIGIVQKLNIPSPSNPEEQRVQVLLAVHTQIIEFSMPDQMGACMRPILALEENLRPIQWDNSEELALAEIIEEMLRTVEEPIINTPTKFVHRTLSQQEKTEIAHSVSLMSAILSSNGSGPLKAKYFERLRLIGGWIKYNYGFDGLVFSCELDPAVHSTLKQNWKMGTLH